MKEYGADSRMVGIIFGTGYIISAVVSQFYPKLRKKIGAKKLLIITALFLIGSFVLARFAGVIFGAILIIGRISSSTTFRNIRSSILNRHISSKNRATTISTVVLLSQLPYAIFAYFIGDYIDKYSPNSLALMLGIIIIVLLIGQSFVFKMAKKRKVFVG
ncbi:hypothetical protein KKE45_02040, partial [Patescibacteria group bacterium]|nr:hypothetical protein [Patescibacteria group bacterium]